jgi:hypothetical protein
MNETGVVKAYIFRSKKSVDPGQAVYYNQGDLNESAFDE